MKVFAQWQEYPAGQGAYGSGGWSRNARRRPAPVVVEEIGTAQQSGKSWIVNGIRKLKLNLWNLDSGERLRFDYPDIPKPQWMADPLIRSLKGSGIPGESEVQT